MKKIAFLVLALIGMKVASAQMVTTSDFSKNYSTYNGQVVTIKEVSGTVKPKINVVNPTTNPGVSAKIGSTSASSSPNPSGSTSTAPTCKTISGYQVVDFTFNTNSSCGCFYIPVDKVARFNEIKATGAKVLINVEVDTKNKINKIKGMDAL